jgi:hypothetical protein
VRFSTNNDSFVSGYLPGFSPDYESAETYTFTATGSNQVPNFTAQHAARIEGSIVSESSGEPLADHSIRLAAPNAVGELVVVASVSTDEFGSFSAGSLKAGRYLVLVGYASVNNPYKTFWLGLDGTVNTANELNLNAQETYNFGTIEVPDAVTPNGVVDAPNVTYVVNSDGTSEITWNAPNTTDPVIEFGFGEHCGRYGGGWSSIYAGQEVNRWAISSGFTRASECVVTIHAETQNGANSENAGVLVGHDAQILAEAPTVSLVDVASTSVTFDLAPSESSHDTSMYIFTGDVRNDESQGMGDGQPGSTQRVTRENLRPGRTYTLFAMTYDSTSDSDIATSRWVQISFTTPD